MFHNAFLRQASSTWYFIISHEAQLCNNIFLPLTVLLFTFLSALLIYIKIYNSVLCQSIKQVAALKSQLQLMSHAMYSSIPSHGISLVAKILSDPDVEALWRKEIKVIFIFLNPSFNFSFQINSGSTHIFWQCCLKVMANRIGTMRTTLRQYLENLESSFNWEHITSQVLHAWLVTLCLMNHVITWAHSCTLVCKHKCRLACSVFLD